FIRANQSGLFGAAAGGITGGAMRIGGSVPERLPGKAVTAGSGELPVASRDRVIPQRLPGNGATSAPRELPAAAQSHPTAAPEIPPVSQFENLYGRVSISRPEPSLADNLLAPGERRSGRVTIAALRAGSESAVGQFRSFDEFARSALVNQTLPARIYDV